MPLSSAGMPTSKNLPILMKVYYELRSADDDVHFSVWRALLVPGLFLCAILKPEASKGVLLCDVAMRTGRLDCSHISISYGVCYHPLLIMCYHTLLLQQMKESPAFVP